MTTCHSDSDSDSLMESGRSWSVEMLRGEKEDNEAVPSEGLEELDFSVTDGDEVNEGEQGSTPLIDACRENTIEMVSLLLTAKADVSLCDCSRLRTLQACPLQLREKVLSWMSRPDLPLQTELLQAAWQADLHSVQTLLTVGVDVNVANADGATPVMLAVRDVDLFEGIAALLPWEHRPVAVLRKPLGLSVDVWLRDHCGRSALDYAANIRSPLREDIWKMTFEAANHADGAHTSLLDLEEHFNQDLASKFGGSDVELDVVIVNNRSPATSLIRTPNQQQHVLLHSQSEMSSWLAAGEEQVVYEKPSTFHRLADTTPCDIQEVLESQGHSRADINQGQSVSGEQERSDSVLRQGLEMGAPGTTSSGTDKGIPLHFQNTMETPRGIRQSNQDTRRGSRGGLCLPSLSCSHLDPSTSPGLLTTRTSCLPAPPKHGQRRKILAASSVSSTRLLTVAQSGQLSHSAPSIMEPLLGPHSGIHARANRLGCEDTGNKQKHILPALSPKLLEPVNKRPEEHAVLPVLRHHPPLKFISNIPLSSWTQPRTERRWGRLRTGPLATKGGSEESGSSSSSLDLEDEGDSEGDVHRKFSGGSHLMFAGDGGLQRLNDKSPPGVDLVQMTVRNIPLNHRSAHRGKPVNASRLSPEQAPDYQCGGKDSNPRQPAHRQTFRRRTGERGEAVHFNALVTFKCEEVKSNAGQTLTEITHREIHETRGEPDECCEGNLRCDLLAKQDFQVDNSTSHREDAKLQTEEKLPSSDLSESNMGVSEDSRKLASGKERRMRTACSQRSNPQTNQRSFNSHDPNKSHCTKSKSSPSYSHSDSKQNKDKNSKSPGIHCEISSPIPRKKGSEKTRRLKVKVSSNRVQQLPALRELKDSHLLKKSSFTGITRSKSAVDVVTYNDMFQQIENGDGGPEIYEMFAGPLYDNLRASSSCDQVQDRKVQSATATCRPLKHTHTRKSPAGQEERTAVSANDRPKHGSSRQKNITSASCKKTQKIKSTTKHDGHEKAESAVPKGPGNCHAQEKGKDEMLSTIEESATLKSDIRTLTSGAGSSRNLPLPDPTFHQSPERLKSNTWEPSSGSSSAIMSPIYQKFLDDVGDGPLTDDLLQCLAEELISLDERDVSTGPCEILGPSQEKPDTEHDPGSGKKELPQLDSSTAGCDSGLADDAITWTKGEVLGKGAYGIVYCGLTGHGQLVAVKQVSLDASDPDAAEGEYARLQGEVELLKTLRHANIVGFLGTSFHQQVVSIFMEYIPGGSMASILHRFGPLPERVLVLYTKQILEGVAYLHLNRVIHRDLKGNNIMLMPTGIIKLIDFGCARRLTCLSHNASNSADLLKSVHGTPYWMAPEVINDSGYGRKSDIWSVGCTVFEMATGKPPLAHMDKLAALFYIGAQRGVMPSLPDGFSETAKDFVQTCLICDQRLRPPAEHLLKHPFIHQNKTSVNISRALKINCSGQTCS